MAEGRPIKAIAAVQDTPPAAAGDAVEKLFLRLAQQASSGGQHSLRRLRLLHAAIVDREEQERDPEPPAAGRGGRPARAPGRQDRRDRGVDVSVVMSDIRGYSTIAEHADPSALAGQLNVHRGEMNRAIIGEGGTVMQFVGDAVMAVFGAPVALADHATHAVAAALAMHRAQDAVNERWAGDGLTAFGLGIGVTTGRAAAALLGSEERLEYTLVGDTVNLAPRLQQWAEPGETILSDATYRALADPPTADPPALVKGRETPVSAWRVPAHAGPDRARRHRRARRSRPARQTRTPHPRQPPGPSPRRSTHERHGSPRGPQDLRVRGGPGARPAGRQRGVDERVRRHHGPVGVRQVDPAQPGRRPRHADRGRDLVGGESLTDKDENALARMRRAHIGIVFQFFNLLEGMSVLENVALPAVIAGTSAQAESRARDLLDMLGLADKHQAAPGVLSGGQRQRLAIARALANQPTLLLADEPTGALDSEGGLEVLELFRRLHAGGQAILLVTHDETVADSATRIVRMRDGRIEDDGLGGGDRGAVGDTFGAPGQRAGRPLRPLDVPPAEPRRPRRRGSRPCSAVGGLALAACPRRSSGATARDDRHRPRRARRRLRPGGRHGRRPPALRAPGAPRARRHRRGGRRHRAAVPRPARTAPRSAGALAVARFAEPVAVALLPVVAMHFLLGLPDGTCRLSRTAIGVGYVLGVVLGVVLWTRRPALPLWPVAVEAVIVVPIGVVGSQRRYVRSRGVERQRMQWFGWAVAVGAEILLVALALRVLWGWPTSPGWWWSCRASRSPWPWPSAARGASPGASTASWPTPCRWPASPASSSSCTW